MNDWTITNDRGLELLGNTHPPTTPAAACVILMHGFKGYKDYGFIPILAHDLCDASTLVHRFNFSTSGMTNETQTFARPDLFALDTWNRQIEDVLRIHKAIENAELPGQGLPLFLIGHSRGGATALLAAGRHGAELDLGGVITINAVDRCTRLPQEEQTQLLERGFSITQSARTKQDLRINSTWLSEQLDDPQGHDVLGQASAISAPVCVIHSENDQAVDPSAGKAIAKACQTQCALIKQGNHVLNMPNPSDSQTPQSPQLLEAEHQITRFIQKYTQS